METVNVEELREDLSFTGDLLVDNSFLLLPKTANLTDSMLKALKEWNFKTLLCEGSLSLGGDIGVDKEQKEEETPKEKIGINVIQAIENSKNNQLGNSDKARMDMVSQVYDEYLNFIEELFTHYVTHKEIDQKALEETVQELCIFIREHKRYILRVTPTAEAAEKNFLVIHSMRSTVLAIAIAMQLHIPLSKMIELGVTCILHEIGMLRLPPQLYMSSRKLSPNEKAQISKHTIFGYTIVKDLNFSLAVQLGVLEHHEKENGTGYPRRLTGDKISSIAKIIAVACTYEAISSPRTYKDEHSTFDALIELIQNKNHQYDDSVLKALLYTVSLYPIGTLVYLSNRKVAEVVDSNPDNPKCPTVQLLTEKEADGSLKIVKTGENNISILRILTKQEKEDILKLLNRKTQGEPVALEPVSDDEVPDLEDAALIHKEVEPQPAPQIQAQQEHAENLQVQSQNQSQPQSTSVQTEPLEKAETAEKEQNQPQNTTSPQPAKSMESKPKTDSSGMEEVDLSDFLGTDDF